MWTVLNAINRGFDIVLAPFARMHPIVGLLVVCAGAGVVMQFIFGKTSNQKMIAFTKNKLKAYIMEMWLFRNDPRVMFGAIGSVVRYNLQYLRHSLRPIIFLFIPVLFIMVQLGIRYAHEPLVPGETTVVTVALANGVRATEVDVSLEAPDGLSVISPPLRINATGEIEWKIRADQCGTRSLGIITPNGRIDKTVVVGEDLGTVRFASLKPCAGTWDAFLYPAEPPVARGSIVRSVEVLYAEREGLLFGITFHWLWIFFIASVIVGFAFKDLFGIEV
ncbi:hypothetical protein K8S17_00145 [bacterium]|nr:hypothetical protein [bacterium]